MADRFPLIVDSSNQNIKELPDGDSLLLGDSEKIRFGDGQDLDIYHDGSHSYVSDVGTVVIMSSDTFHACYFTREHFNNELYTVKTYFIFLS